MTTSKRPSGGASLIKAGKRPVLLGLRPEQHDLLRAAAEAEGRPLTQFLIYHGLQAARKNLKKTGSLT